MRNKIRLLAAGLLTLTVLSACGTDTEITKFKNEMDQFCTAISELDTSINNIDPSAENAPELVLKYLDQLDQKFQEFAALDFPEEYDYLEPLADEAGDLMATAVASYHEVYKEGGYNEETATYARENSARAYKRVQVIISCLKGEQPTAASTDSSSGSSL